MMPQMMRQTMKDLMRPLPLMIQQSLLHSSPLSRQPASLLNHPDNTEGTCYVHFHFQAKMLSKICYLFSLDSAPLHVVSASNTQSLPPLSDARVVTGLNTPSRQTGKCLFITPSSLYFGCFLILVSIRSSLAYSHYCFYFAARTFLGCCLWSIG